MGILVGPFNLIVIYSSYIYIFPISLIIFPYMGALIGPFDFNVLQAIPLDWSISWAFYCINLSVSSTSLKFFHWLIHLDWFSKFRRNFGFWTEFCNFGLILYLGTIFQNLDWLPKKLLILLIIPKLRKTWPILVKCISGQIDPNWALW